MFETGFFNALAKSDYLPPMTLPIKVKRKDVWKRAVMDSFEHIGLKQLRENLTFFDNYRMVEGRLTFQELSEVVPNLHSLEELLSGAGIPAFLRHYDITSIIINTIVDKYVDFQDKFHVTDTGEIAQNEYLRHKTEEIQELLSQIIDTEINAHLAEMGLDPNGKEFGSEEEKQQFQQQIEQVRQKYTAPDTKASTESTFKTIGVQWGEATLDHDKERFNLLHLGKLNLKDYLISGRCFREYKIYHDKYQPIVWSPKNTFFSKEVSADDVSKGEYVGRIQPMTPSEVIREHGHLIDTETQQQLLGGNTSWMNYQTTGIISGNIQDAINNNFSKIETVPFKGYNAYNFMVGLEDQTGVPMGIETVFNKDGSQDTRERYLPRMPKAQQGVYNALAALLRADFVHRKDLCQVTEVYFKSYDLWGYLTYVNEKGRVVTEEVTEDILPQFIKDNNIKETYKESLHDIITEFEENTLKWQYRPVVYRGIKIMSANLKQPIYLEVEPMENQIKGDSDFEVLLPVAGKIGESLVGKILPFQAKYNLCMNQISALIEKELGMVLLMSTDLIPSEYEGWGSADEALLQLRNTAKSVGLMPFTASMDSQKNMAQGPIQVVNVSHAQEIQTRVQMAEFFQKKAYELIGINPLLNQPTKYETAEGVKTGQETNVAQISGVHEEYSIFNKSALSLHLAVAQYCQANNKDLSLYYTKSDASIQFLKMSDPDLPYRRLGLIATYDSQKRKELEQFRQYLLNTNTLGADTLELAKLIGSDSFSEVVELARIEREHRQADEDKKQQQALEQQQQQAQLEDQNNQKQWERLESSKQKDRETQLERERISALGRAADKQADPNSFTQINAQADHALRATEISNQMEMQAKDLQLREQQHKVEMDTKAQELALKAKQLEEQAKKRQSAEYIATINKN